MKSCSLPHLALAALLAVLAVSLQGCDSPLFDGYLVTSASPSGPGGKKGKSSAFGFGRHKVAYWRQAPDYRQRLAHEDPVSKGLVFNSCMNPNLGALEVCSRRGKCMAFDQSATPVFFCQCEPDWGGPECDIRRKRQSVTWLLSLFFGPLGLDELYLGMPLHMLSKQLLTTMGVLVALVFGLPRVGSTFLLVPWLYDVVRFGSTTAEAADWRTSDDLPRWVFTVFSILFFSFVALAVAVASLYHNIRRKRWLWDHRQNYSAAKVIN